MVDIESSEGFWFIEKDGLHADVDLAAVLFMTYSESSRVVKLFYGAGLENHVDDVGQELYEKARLAWVNVRRKQ
jgi:hypothetical protein